MAEICSAQNLVQNPGFEDTVRCPDYISELDYAVGWHTLLNTPDYYNECNNTSSINPGMVGVPVSARGYQPAHSGAAFAGEVNYYTSQTDYRETFYSQLSSPLVAGKTYDVGMWVIMDEDHAQWAVDGDLGIYLSNVAPNAALIFTYVPQIANPHGNVLNDTLNWTKISGSYTATGGEQYITIGSFIPDSQLTIINRGGSYPFTSYAIDDVWVILNNSTATDEIREINSVSVFPNPFSAKCEIRFLVETDAIEQVRIFDISGKELLSPILFMGGHYEVNLTEYSDGIYFAEVITNKGGLLWKKLIKE